MKQQRPSRHIHNGAASVDIGKRLRALRERAGKSLMDVEREAGVRQPTLSRIENGYTKSPRAQTIRQLVSLYGATTDFMSGASDAMQPKDVLSADTLAQSLFRLYSKLSPAKRSQLVDFAAFLETR